MPIAHVVDEEHRVVRFTVAGAVTATEMLAAIDRAMEDVGGREGFRVLSDHRRIAKPATTDQIKEVVAHLGRYASTLANTRWAIVVGHVASFGMMRMLSVFAEGIPIDVEVFTEPAEAERWLVAGPS